MKCKSRKRDVVYARQEFTYIAKTQLQLSYPSIGRIFEQDHTTALHSARAHAERNNLPSPTL